MSDDVTVANLAMSLLGEEDQIRDLADTGSHAARSINAVWVPVRRRLLRQGKYNFSIWRDELTAQAATSPGYRSPAPYSNRFPLAADNLRLLEIVQPSWIAEFYASEGGAILADTDGPVIARCVHDVVDATLWDDLFVNVMATGIAFQCADRITGDRGRKSDAWAAHRKAIADAGQVDAQEDPPIETPDSSWVTARYGGAW